MEDLSTDEEERVHGQMKNYEKKIENLMSEMGSLKNEVGIVRNHWKLNQSHLLHFDYVNPPPHTHTHKHHQQCKKKPTNFFASLPTPPQIKKIKS